MSLHNHCEAVEQSLTKCIKYSKSYDYFHASTPTLKSLNLDLTQSDVTPVVVWMRPSIHDKGKCMSLYNYCEATEQSFNWYFKHSSSYDYFYVYIPPPESQNLGLYKRTFMPVMVWMSPSIHDEGKCSLYMTIARLQDRVLPDTSNILAAIAISMLLPSPPKSQNWGPIQAIFHVSCGLNEPIHPS